MVWAAERAKVPPSETLAITDRAKAMKREGIDMVSLAAGQPDFVTPAHIREYVKKALDEGYTFYPDVAGVLELRQAIAEKLNKENRFEADPKSEIIVTVGGKEAVFASVLATVNPRDEVLLTDPAWVTYEPCVRFAGGVPVHIPLKGDDAFNVNAGEVEKRISSRTKMIVINSPCNPTGSVMSKQDLEALAEVACRRNLLVLSDEIYERIIYEDVTHYSLASFPDMKDRTITVNGFSKTLAMTGWRLGYVIANKEIIGHIKSVHGHMVTGPCTFAQKAVADALMDKRTEDSVRSMVKKFAERRKLIMNGLSTIEGVSCINPKGTFYTFPNFSSVGKPSAELAEFLLEKARVATIPGSAFGSCGEGYLRISFAASEEDIRKGVERIEAALEGDKR